MASIYDIKPAFQALLRPLTRGLARAGVTANQVTVIAALLSAAVGACLWHRPLERWPLLLLPGFLFVRMALNAIDGMLAREHGMKSRLGAVLNEVGDVAADTALYLPLALVPGFAPPLVVVITILAIISEMTGVVAVQIGAARRYDGPMGKSDRAFVFGLLALLLGLGVPAGPWLYWAQVVVGGLLVVTIVRRARRALEETP
ncbi:MAG: CDP-alcohol phosphatidyltransferase family protein [Opitutaceae bacterium]|nr:CDP-alcohol phosphatidyltransferase family protein [Opitutaceae bacterium]